MEHKDLNGELCFADARSQVVSKEGTHPPCSLLSGGYLQDNACGDAPKQDCRSSARAHVHSPLWLFRWKH